MGFATAKTEILQTGEWTFLESIRFDRHGLWGRSSLCSFGFLVEEYPGNTWLDAAVQLSSTGQLSKQDVKAIAWLVGFGVLIGNTDMHFGNLSLIAQGHSYSLAPVYDMAPMAYSPEPGGVIPSEPLEPDVLAVKADIEDIATAAATFWHMATRDPRISKDFRKICSENVKKLNKRNNAPTLKRCDNAGWDFF